MPERTINAVVKSDTKAYDNWRGIIKNRVYREEWGETINGEPVYIGCFYVVKGEDVAFYCGIAISLQIWAMSLFGLARTVRNVNEMASAWESEVQNQLRRISKGNELLPYHAADKERLVAALRLYWPTNVAQDEEKAAPEPIRSVKLTEPAKVLPAAPDAVNSVKQVSLDFD